jgi:hypothetical protein
VSLWIDRIKTHPINGQINTLKSVIQAVSERVQSDPNAVVSLERIERIISYLESVLKQVDPLLVSPQLLSNVAGPLTNALNELNNYKSNSNLNHLTNANAHLDATLNFIGQIPVVATSDDLANIRESASKYYEFLEKAMSTIKQAIDSIENDNKDSKAKLEGLTKEIGVQKQRLDNALNDFTKKSSDSIGDFIINSAKAEEERQKDFLAAAQDRLKLLNEENKNRDANFNENLGKFNNSFDKFLTASKDQFDNLNDSFKTQSEAQIKSIEEKKAYAEKIVGLIANTGMVGGYQRTANEERKGFIIWRRIATWSFVALIGFALVTFLITVNGHFEWGSLLGRLLVTITFALLAGYAGLQAEKHQKAERFNRTMELEIASIDPFLATLSDEERNQVKKQMAEKIFGQNNNSSMGEASESKNLLELVSMFLNTIQKILKR